MAVQADPLDSIGQSLDGLGRDGVLPRRQGIEHRLYHTGGEGDAGVEARRKPIAQLGVLGPDSRGERGGFGQHDVGPVAVETSENVLRPLGQGGTDAAVDRDVAASGLKVACGLAAVVVTSPVDRPRCESDRQQVTAMPAGEDGRHQLAKFTVAPAQGAKQARSGGLAGAGEPGERSRRSGRRQHRLDGKLVGAEEGLRQGVDRSFDGEDSPAGQGSARASRHVGEDRIGDPAVFLAKGGVEIPRAEERCRRPPGVEAEDPRRDEPGQYVSAEVGLGQVAQHYKEVVVRP